MFGHFFPGKRVLITGHTGFKGAWTALWLKQLGAIVSGLGLPAPTDPNFHELIQRETFHSQLEADLRDFSRTHSALQKAAPEIIFHLAAQPLVRRSYAEPLETFQTNALGTANLLEAVRRLELPCSIVVVTSDKCYENRGWEFGYRENDPLGGSDVYSMSKAAAELVAHSWRHSFFSRNPRLGNIATARAGNVIGGGDYAENRIVPDAIRALLVKRAIPVRNPASTRPWQHVLDCVSGYLWLGACLANAEKESPLAGAFNFGPGIQANLPVSALVSELLSVWPGEWAPAPLPNAPPEAEKLNLAIDRAAALLQWRPVCDFQQAIRLTVEWYRERHLVKNSDMTAFSAAQIESYQNLARTQGLAWAR
jgi:CDP-glucose 4,6-dehydratase